jgi:hypothetical protein
MVSRVNRHQLSVLETVEASERGRGVPIWRSRGADEGGGGLARLGTSKAAKLKVTISYLPHHPGCAAGFSFHIYSKNLSRYGNGSDRSPCRLSGLGFCLASKAARRVWFRAAAGGGRIAEMARV